MEVVPLINEQKNVVAAKFDELMSYANKGSYEQFFKPEQLTEVRYEIGEELYGFILSAEKSPLSIVQPADRVGKYKEIYKVPPFTSGQSEFLLKPKRRRKSPGEPEEIFALIQRMGKKRKIIDLYENKDTIL